MSLLLIRIISMCMSIDYLSAAGAMPWKVYDYVIVHDLTFVP